MGTRHLQTVINKEGETKLSQYGQWDGYPSGQGKDILKFLRGMNREKYLEEVNKLRTLTPEEDKMVEADKEWAKNYPYLSRDCGSKIHQMIQDGEVKFIQLCTEKEASMWCEGFYTIDFKNNKFIAEFHNEPREFDLDNLPTEEEFLELMRDEEND